MDNESMLCIDESMHLEEEWYKEARKQTKETLPEFIRHVMNDYHHDYGTVCKAIAACAVAASYAANEEPQGGIIGFQASAVMWEYILAWMSKRDSVGMKLIDYSDMLFPQYEHKFQKTISRSMWNRIQERAKELLNDETRTAHPDVIKHWRSLSVGMVPFGYTVKEDGDD